MTLPDRAHRRPRFLAVFTLPVSLLLLDCASPGPPRPPSLRLPRVVRDLSATRTGEGVEVRFTVPQESTDGLPLHNGTALGSVCRAEGKGPCVSFPGAPTLQLFPAQGPAGGPNVITLHDPLDPGLRSGPLRPLAYRAEFFTAAQRSAGPSAPVLALAGEVPAAVQGLVAEGSRRGVVLHWTGTPVSPGTEVLLQRELVGAEAAAKTRKQNAHPGRTRATSSEAPGTVWLETHAIAAPTAGRAGSGDRTLDDTAEPGQTYRYAAQRRRVVQVDGHTLEARSELSPPVLLTFGDNFAPPKPTNLTAAGFGEGAQYAVDLIWEPVDDRAVTGYVVSRVRIDASGRAQGEAETLTPAAVAAPAFHDTTADATRRYRYTVIAVDAKGNHSEAATADVEPLRSP